MKKLINRPETVVSEALAGMSAAHPDLVRVHVDPNYIVRADAPVSGKVTVLSGGGSGQEPMHGGFVGSGMLDAAVPGAVFTSPTPDQILEATQAVSGGVGVLYIVKNYAGDIMNFEMAAELDSAIGDADHGANMDRGTQAVIAKLGVAADQDISALLKLTAIILISTVGGSDPDRPRRLRTEYESARHSPDQAAGARIKGHGSARWQIRRCARKLPNRYGGSGSSRTPTSAKSH